MTGDKSVNPETTVSLLHVSNNNCANSLAIWVSCNVVIHHVPREPWEVFDLLADY
jgi:hypothetical protein